MKKRSGFVKNYQEWIKPKLVGNALELLEKEIPKYKSRIDFVHLCFSTDPFMYQQPEVVDLSLKIIGRLNKEGIRCTALTKGLYPRALLNKKKYSIQNEYGITLVSLDEKFKLFYEPFSSPFKERIKSLEALHKGGLRTWVSIEPYPTPNIVQQDLSELLLSISFVDKIVFGKWNYNGLVSSYRGNIKYYNECADIVESFCKERNINCHIKFGTKTKKQPVRVETERLFDNCSRKEYQSTFTPLAYV